MVQTFSNRQSQAEKIAAVKKEKIVIWGASGHALVVANILKLQGQYDIAGYLDSINTNRKNESFNDSIILGGEEQLEILKDQGIQHILFGFGDCQARLRLGEKLKALGFFMPRAIHPKAIIAPDAKIEEGVVINAGAVIDTAVHIGESAIVGLNASISHESIIEAGVHICPGVHLAGKVTIGRGTWVGIGTVVSHRVHIGQGCVIGAGAVVVNDIPDSVVAVGVPAKVLKKVEGNEI